MMKSTRTRKALAAFAAATLASVALAGPIQAQPDEPEAEAPPVAEVDEGFVCDIDFEGDFEDWTPTADELAEINADTDALIKHLADNGITVAIETDEFGFTYPALDDTTDDTTWDLIDQYYEDLYGDIDFDDEFEDCELTGCDGSHGPEAKATEDD